MVDGRALTAQFEGAADFETRKVLCGGQLLTVLFLDGLTSGGDIAEQVGIGSEQTMYRLFKQYMGCSPGEYRKHPSADSTIAAETADEYHESEE